MAPIAAQSTTSLLKETTAITKDLEKEGQIAHTVHSLWVGMRSLQGKGAEQGYIATGL
jgi:hypothetical protein